MSESIFPPPAGPVPWLTTEQMIEVDRRMVDDYQISLTQMMENAGRALAEAARQLLGGDVRKGKLVVMAGPGGNGGGALVAARRLHGYGSHVLVLLSRSAKDLTPVTLRQLNVVRRIGLPIGDLSTLHPGEHDLIIDGLIGYRLHGNPQGDTARLINWANGSGIPLLALDVPSGLDASTGEAYEPFMRAGSTLTLALPKEGLRRRFEAVGDLLLADIGVPRELYRDMGLDVGPIFAHGDIVHLSVK